MSNPDKSHQHGVFLDILDYGVLITGASGCGKSEVALQLLHMGHRLIADDNVCLQKKEHQLIGTCPEILADFLEVRGLGILNIRKMFGDAALTNEQQLHLVIHLQVMDFKQIAKLDRIHGKRTTISFLDCAIPKVWIPVSPGRNLGILIETAVRDQQLRDHQGYIASEAFSQRQASAL